MKKKQMGRICNSDPFKKILQVMKLSVFFFFLGFVQVLASNSFAQKTKLSLDVKNVSIESVLLDIENQSEYKFIYNKEKVDVDSHVNVQLQDKSVEEALDILLEGRNISYTLFRNNIVLSTADAPTIQGQQQKSVSGKVTDSSATPLPGVTIIVKGINKGTVTDAQGGYSLAGVPSDAILTFSFVGMKTQEVDVAGRTVINIKLEEESIGIEEVVAVGYGKVQKKEELTGSVAVVKTEALADRVSPSVINMLQGTAAGVTVRQESSYPGMIGSIMIRNTSSWQGSTEPLYVIDGVISTSSDFSRLSSTDIGSISVLKDAASSAIYGMRAGNGVIIINTKQGNAEKTQLTYQVSNTMQEATSITSRPPDTYTALAMSNKALKNLGFTDDHPWIFAADELEYFKTHNFDPLDAVLGDPGIKNHTLSVSGGKGDTKYYVSGSVFNQDGFTKNYTYNKYSFLAKVSGKINKNVSFDLTFNMGWSDMNQPYAGDDYAQGGVFGWTLAEQRFVPPYIDGKPLREMTTIADGQSGIQHLKSNMSKPVFKLKYQVPFVKGLSVSGIASYENQYDYMKRFVTVPYYYAFKMTGSHNHIYTNEVDITQGNNGLLPSGVVRGLCGGLENQLTVNTARLYSYDLQGIVNYDRIFGKHNISAMAGYEQWATGGDYLNGWGRNYTNTNFQEIDGADPGEKYTGVSGTQTNLSGQASYFGRFDYNYDRKYMLGFTFRADGTYIFPPDSRWGYFPAVSAAWNMSEEAFFERLKPYVSTLKLRASYGLTGSSATGPWQWQQSYAYSSSINYILDGVASSGVGLGTVVNPNITWEKNKNIDLGTDITLFKGLGTITMDYWHKKTTDILAARVSSTPNTVGASLPAVNYGEAAASGFEISVGHNNSIGAFKYGASGNFAISSNKYLKIDQSTIVRDYQNVIGTSIDGQIWGYHCEGIIRSQADVDKILAEHGDNFTLFGYKPKPGMLMYSDVRGPLGTDSPDGIVDGYDQDRLTQDAVPRINYGIHLNCEWKGFALNMDFAGFAKYKGLVDEYHGRRPYFPWGIWLGYNLWEDFWTADNPNAAMPDPCWSDENLTGYNVQAVSDFWIKNRSFLRLKNVNLSYSLPSRILDTVKVKGVTFYVAGENLLTFSNYYIDPEQNGMRALPVLKSVTLGAKITF
jgi:TonB-linked SusC/RagA family outer membrane protein